MRTGARFDQTVHIFWLVETSRFTRLRVVRGLLETGSLSRSRFDYTLFVYGVSVSMASNGEIAGVVAGAVVLFVAISAIPM